MYRSAERVLKIGFSAEDKGETVEGVIPIIHEHLDIIEDPGIQVLCLINGKKEGLAFLLVKIIDLILYGTEHTCLAAPVADTEDLAEFLVKFRNTHCGKTSRYFNGCGNSYEL